MSRKLRESLVGHRSGILFLLISDEGVFPHPRLLTSTIAESGGALTSLWNRCLMCSSPSAFAMALALCVAAFGQGDSDSHSAAQPSAQDAYEKHKEAAIRINDLAGRVHTEADATAYVSEIAVLFASELP